MSIYKKMYQAKKSIDMAAAAKQHRAAGRTEAASNMEAEAMRLAQSLEPSAGQQWLVQELVQDQLDSNSLFDLL